MSSYPALEIYMRFTVRFVAILVLVAYSSADYPPAICAFTLGFDFQDESAKDPVEFAVDANDAPEMKDWMAKAARVCEGQYKMICEELRSDGFKPPKRVTMTLKKDYKGVAST